eukprot:TRINITY_DN3517_c0_g1_i2.p1 TRINITY_DN3517_c0_g1~~TRINITY_DN3517_c0_g1_i2.p1  ORF type:complete len:368 (+),score=99.96 TRINITY_DN3517_c0_g1_i2:157-1260(+)
MCIRDSARGFSANHRTKDARELHYVLIKPTSPPPKHSGPRPCVLYIPAGNHSKLEYAEEEFFRRSGLLEAGWLVVAMLNTPGQHAPFIKQDGWCTDMLSDFLHWLTHHYQVQGKVHFMGNGNGGYAAWEGTVKNKGNIHTLTMINAYPCNHGGVGLLHKEKLVKKLLKIKDTEVFMACGSRCEDILPNCMRAAGAITTMGLQRCTVEVVQNAGLIDIMLPEASHAPHQPNPLATDVAHHLMTAHRQQVEALKEWARKHGAYHGHHYPQRGQKQPLGRKPKHAFEVDMHRLSGDEHMAFLAKTIEYERGIEYMFNFNPPHDPSDTPGEHQPQPPPPQERLRRTFGEDEVPTVLIDEPRCTMGWAPPEE